VSILTISRQPGSLGDEIAQMLSQRLGWDLIRRDTLFGLFFSDLEGSHEYRMLMESAKRFLTTDDTGRTYKERVEQGLRALAREKSLVLVGFGSQALFAEDPDALHVRVIASQPVRVRRFRKQYHLPESEAARLLETSDRKHRRFVSTVYGIDLTDPSLYHLILHTDRLTVGEGADTLAALVQSHEALRQMERETVSLDAMDDHLADPPVFKNKAEEEFAKILDMYQIDWRYEPRTFPVEWDSEGNVKMAFSPDFYLPKFNTYIELTTMNQKYVTMKNRKAKKVRELYPGTNIKIMYKKDIQALAERFGTPRKE